MSEWGAVFARAKMNRAVEMAKRACDKGDYALADRWVGEFAKAVRELNQAAL